MPSSHSRRTNRIGCTITWGPLVDKGWRGMAEGIELREPDGRRNRQGGREGLAKRSQW